MANLSKEFKNASALPVCFDPKGKPLQPEKKDPVTGEVLPTIEALEALLEDAKKAKPKLDLIGKILAGKFGGDYVEGPLKTKESALRTTDLKHPGHPEYLCDLTRGYITLKNKKQILQIVDFLGSKGIKTLGQKSIDVADVSNSFARPGGDNLRNLNIKFAVPLGESYHFVEIQCIHKDALKPYKDSHAAYKKSVGYRTELQDLEKKLASEEPPEKLKDFSNWREILAEQWRSTNDRRLSELKRRTDINSAVVEKCGLDEIRDALNAPESPEVNIAPYRNKVESFALQPI